jgi:hypothetical protein
MLLIFVGLINKLIVFVLKKISTNIFSGISLLLNFLLLIKINSNYGISSDTDIYFFSIVLVTFISIVSQLVWESITKYYIEFESKINFKSSYLYSSLLNLNVLFSIFIIALYFFMTKYTDLVPDIYVEFLNVFIFYVLVQNIYTYNKYVLNIQKRYNLFYVLDIFVVLFNLMTIYLFSESGIIVLACSIIISTSITLIYQFILIFIKYNVKYYFVFYVVSFKYVYINSFNLKLGQVLYLSKDILISSYIQNMNIDGLYSLYTYAFKLVSLSFQVIQIPIFNKYITEISVLLKNKENISNIKLFISKNIFKTFMSISLFQIVVYLFLSEILSVLSYQITINQINETKVIFVLLSFASLIYLVISFIERYLSFVGLYKKTLRVSLIFFTIILINYHFLDTNLIEYSILFLIILPSLIYLLLVIRLYLNLLKGK